MDGPVGARAGGHPVGEQPAEAKPKALRDVLSKLYQENVSQEEKISADVRFAEIKANEVSLYIVPCTPQRAGIW